MILNKKMIQVRGHKIPVSDLVIIVEFTYALRNVDLGSGINDLARDVQQILDLYKLVDALNVSNCKDSRILADVLKY